MFYNFNSTCQMLVESCFRDLSRLSSCFSWRGDQTAVTCSQELCAKSELLQDFRKQWLRRDPNTQRDLFAVVCLYSHWLSLTAPASSYGCCIVRGNRQQAHCTHTWKESSHLSWGKLGRVMRLSSSARRPRPSQMVTGRDSGTDGPTETGEKERNI